MRRRIVPLQPLVVLLGIAALLSTAHAEVSEVTVGRLGGMSDAVLVGRVVRTVHVPVQSLPNVDLRVEHATLACVMPIEWIKGEPRPELLWYWATPAWLDDIAHAVEGERCLFFLEAAGVADLVDVASLARLNELTSGQSIHRVAWAGHGRMPLRSVAGVEYVTLRKHVKTPATLDTIPAAVPTAWHLRRSVPLADLLAYLRTRLVSIPKRVAELAGLDVAGLLRALDGTHEIREEALGALGMLGSSSLPALREILYDAGSPLRENAAHALADQWDQTLEILREDLRSEVVAIRRGAAFAAEQIGIGYVYGSGEKEAALAGALADPDPEVRWRMLRFFAGNREPFESTLARAVIRGLRDPEDEVRWHAARCVTELFLYGDEPWPEGMRGAVEQRLLPLVRGGSLKVRRAAWEALGVTATSASWESAKAALSDPDPVVRVNAVAALALVGTKQADEQLRALLDAPDPWMRRTAIHALGMARASSAVDPLAKLLGDADRDIRWLAVGALDRMGPKAGAAITALEALLASEQDAGLRAWIREALASIRRK